MQVNPVININFSSKYYISNDARETANALLCRMKKDTVYKKDPKTSNRCTEILSTLSMGKVQFKHTALYNPYAGNPKISKNFPDCTLKVGKNFLNINIQTGEVLSYKTGVFTSLRSLISKADKYMKELSDNFNNSDVVKKNTLITGGYIKLT